MAFSFGIAETFAHGHWVGPALCIFLLICVLGYLGYYGVKDSRILPLLMLQFVTTLGAGAVVGALSYEGSALSKEKGQEFVADVWMEPLAGIGS